MWFAALDGLLAGALITAALLRRWLGDRVGSVGAIAAVGLVGGLVGGLLSFALIAGSTASGPLQVAAIVGGGVGAAVTLTVFRSWVLGDRVSARAALVAADAAATRAARQGHDGRKTAKGPSALAELAIAVLLVVRRRGRD